MSRPALRSLAALIVLASVCCGTYASGTPAFPSPPSDIVSSATSVTWNYRYSHDYSAHTNGAYICGKMLPFAMASWAGNTATDYRYMRQIRAILSGSTCLVAAGGYGAQHERLFTGACVILRETPRLWNQLNATEQHQIDLLMKAALVASAYTTSDYGNASSQNTDLMGGTNLGRGWNPNFREGMIGGMIVGTIWLGGAEGAYDFLNNYDHAAFTAELQAAGLTNTYITFNYKVDHPTSSAPSATMIQNDIRNYKYMGYGLDQLMEIYWKLTTYTYDKNVNTGLNGGVGINGGGKMVSGQAGLPNLGVKGMLHEFDGSDGSGPRSSAGYAYDGFRPNLVNQICMLITGYWESGDMADECLELMPVGIEDLFYKLRHGYINYSNGKVGGTLWMDDDGRDFYWTESVWYDVIAKYHNGELAVADAGPDATFTDTDADGLATIVLDGAASTAEAGQSITSWTWTLGGNVVATAPTASLDMAGGLYDFTLTIATSGGTVCSDTVSVTADVPDLLADAGDDIAMEADAPTGDTLVTLDGTGSFSRTSTIIIAEWKEGSTVLSTGASLTPTVALAPGTHTITLTIYDALYNVATDTVDVSITVPLISARAGSDVAAEAAPGGTASVALDGTASYSQYGTIIFSQWTENGSPLALGTLSPTIDLAPGVHVITLQVFDDMSNSDTDTVTVTVTAAQGNKPGDANGDNGVDIADFVILKQNYGTTSGATWAQGDFNADGAVDIADFVILKQNYGS